MRSNLNFNKCFGCANRLDKLDICKYCHYEPLEEFKGDNWDILLCKDDDGWHHHQILWRLYAKDIECLFADIWMSENIAILIGCNTNNMGRVADALGVNKKVLYNDSEHGLIIINLLEEKLLRRGIKYD